MKEEYIILNAESVLAVELHNQTLFCGCDKGQICMVDLRTKGSNLIHSGENNDVSSICFRKSNTNMFFSAVGEKVFYYDIRNSANPVSVIHENADEINKIDIHPSDKYIAMSDDKGDTVIYNIENNSRHRLLTGIHDNICSSVVFHPLNHWQLISSGLDCQVVMWDFQRKKARSIASLIELLDNSFSVPLLTPPLAYAMGLSADGTYLAVGAQDGAVYLFRLQKRWLEFCGSIQAHLHGISAVSFAPPSAPSMLVTAATDGKCLFYDFEKIDAIEDEDRPFRLISLAQPEFLKGFVPHGKKVNDIAVARSTCHNRDVLFVSDITNYVTCYNLL